MAQLYDSADMLSPEARSHRVAFISSINQHMLPKPQFWISHLQLSEKYEHINSEIYFLKIPKIIMNFLLNAERAYQTSRINEKSVSFYK